MWEYIVETMVDEFNGTFQAVPPLIAFSRLLAALALGALVGLEREFRHKPAGLRTHILVSLAACLFIVVSQQLAAMPFRDSQSVRVDPLRLIEAVTAGVAFLAAGIIFTSKGEVRNTTTGASLWLVGAIGLACGAGQIPLAAMATVMVVLVLFLLRWFERGIGTH